MAPAASIATYFYIVTQAVGNDQDNISVRHATGPNPSHPPRCLPLLATAAAPRNCRRLICRRGIERLAGLEDDSTAKLRTQCGPDTATLGADGIFYYASYAHCPVLGFESMLARRRCVPGSAPFDEGLHMTLQVMGALFVLSDHVLEAARIGLQIVQLRHHRFMCQRAKRRTTIIGAGKVIAILTRPRRTANK